MIVGKKIKLKLVKEKDLPKLFTLLEQTSFRCEGFIDTLSPEHLLYEKWKQKGFWQEDNGIMLIVDKKENIVGALMFRKCEIYHQIDIKYIIFEEEDRGKGYMKEALLLFSSFLFSTKEINRLTLAIPDYHRASIAVAQKCGYKFEGISRGAYFSKGKYIDMCIYSCLRDECKNIDKLYEN
jgi:[ribosomal protein S5]-alanine N-acetyltransferase